MIKNHLYLEPIIKKFEENANPQIAIPKKKYMLNQFDFFGIQAPLRKTLETEFFKSNGFPDSNEIDLIIKNLWDLHQRECQYFGNELLDKMIKKSPKDMVDTLEFMVVNKSWWDTVDFTASRLVGVLFRNNSDLIVPYTNKWMNSNNIWLQRVCILFQLKYKKNTDFDLMKNFILSVCSSKEFFIQKAIGWALREYSKTNPEAVRFFVENNTNKLAKLSIKEGMRIIINNY